MDVEKIREDQFKAWWERTVGNGQWTTLERLAAHDAWMAALSSLDPEVIRRETKHACMLAADEWAISQLAIQEQREALGKAILSAEPAQDDGKAEVGDVVMLIYNDGSQGPREWTRWLADHSPLEGDVPAVRCVILMRSAEVKRMLEEGKA